MAGNPPRATWLKQAARAGHPFHYQAQKPWVHNLINLSAVAFVGASMGAILWGASRVSPWIGIPVGGALFGCFLFSVFILVIHECSHVMFLLGGTPEQNRNVNHTIGYLVGIPLFTNYRDHWERGHVTHHLNPADPEVDPQNPHPLDGRELYKKYALLAVIPLFAVAVNPSRRYPASPLRLGAAVLFWVVVIATLVNLLGWSALGVLLVGFNVVAMLNLTKIAQEHASGLAAEPDPWLRSRTYFYPTSLLTSPFNINYHFEHHLNFNVPWYRLPAYHRAVMALMPAEVKPYYLTRGVKEFLSQLAGTRAMIPGNLRGFVEEAPQQDVSGVAG